LFHSETHGSNSSVLSEEVGERHPHRSDFAAARPTDCSSCPPPSMRLRHLVPLRPCGCGILSPSVHASAASCPFLPRLPQPQVSFLPLLLQVLFRCSLFFYFLQPRTASSPAFAPLAEGTLTVRCCTTQHLRLFVRSSALTHLCVVCRVSFPQIWYHFSVCRLRIRCIPLLLPSLAGVSEYPSMLPWDCVTTINLCGQVFPNYYL
jgi:hypothetical protein